MPLKEEISHLREELGKLNWRIILPLMLLIIVLDQVTKQYFDSNYIIHERHVVIPDFLWFTLHYNKGIAFGIRLFENQVIFVLFSLIAVCFIFAYLVSLKLEHKLMPFVIALIIGGAIGNIIDRALFGQVIDFIEVEFPNIHIDSFEFLGFSFSGFHMETWPIFNVADSAVSVGMVSILILISRENRKKKKALSHASS